MAFDFKGGKNKGGATFDPTENLDLFEEPAQSPPSKGFGGFTGFTGFSSGSSQPPSTTSSSDLTDSGLDIPDYGNFRSRKSVDLSNFPWKVLFTVLLITVPIVLCLIFWEQVLELLYTVGAVLIIAIVLIVILRILFRPRRR